jgi:hypothetical protein
LIRGSTLPPRLYPDCDFWFTASRAVMERVGAFEAGLENSVLEKIVLDKELVIVLVWVS